MADDPNNRGAQDRSEVEIDEDDEVHSWTEMPRRTAQGDVLTHPEEIRFEAVVIVREKPVARANLRTTPAGLVCAGLAVAGIVLSSAAATAIVRRARPK